MVKHKLYVGDNYAVLDMLIEEKFKVDMIYIDPIYHAQNHYFKKYNDNEKLWFTTLVRKIKKSTELLKDDGLIFISIGDDQVCKLRLACDKMFGDDNRIAMIAVKTPNQTEGLNVIKNTEYLLIYGMGSDSKLHFEEKDQEARCTTGRYGQAIQSIDIPAGVSVEKVADGIYRNKDIKRTGGYEDVELTNGPIVVENGRLKNGITLRCRWSCPKDVRAWANKIKNGSTEPIYNKYGKELTEFYLWSERFQPRMKKKGFKKIPTTWDQYLTKGKNELTDIIGKHDFSYPKSVEFVKDIIKLGTGKDDAVVLDYYAGSGTTLQAVAEINQEDGKNIKAILVTNNENGIVDKITKPRIEALQTGIRPDGSKYSEGMDFEYEKIDIDDESIYYDMPSVEN